MVLQQSPLGSTMNYSHRIISIGKGLSDLQVQPLSNSDKFGVKWQNLTGWKGPAETESNPPAQVVSPGVVHTGTHLLTMNYQSNRGKALPKSHFYSIRLLISMGVQADNTGSPFLWQGFELTASSQEISPHCNTSCHDAKKLRWLMKTTLLCVCVPFSIIRRFVLEIFGWFLASPLPPAFIFWFSLSSPFCCPPSHHATLRWLNKPLNLAFV